MRGKVYGFVLGFLGLLLMGVPVALAHHSFEAEFDGSKLIYITGVLTKFDWANPHMYVYVDAKDSNGKVTSWVFEGSSPNLVTRTGTHREDFVSNIGKMVTVRACPAKNGTNRGSGETIKMADGRELLFGGKRYRGDEKSGGGGGIGLEP